MGAEGGQAWGGTSWGDRSAIRVLFVQHDIVSLKIIDAND